MYQLSLNLLYLPKFPRTDLNHGLTAAARRSKEPRYIYIYIHISKPESKIVRDGFK